MTSSPVYSSNLLIPTGNTQADIPAITSFFDNLSTCTKSALSLDDMEEQMTFNHAVNVTAGTTINSLPFSPNLMVSAHTSVSTHDRSPALYNDSLNIDKDISILKASSEQHSTAKPSRISMFSSTPIESSSIGFNLMAVPDLSNSFGDNVIMSSLCTNAIYIKQ